MGSCYISLQGNFAYGTQGITQWYKNVSDSLAFKGPEDWRSQEPSK